MFRPDHRPLLRCAAQRLSSGGLLRTHLAAALFAAGGVACGAVAHSGAARSAAPAPNHPACSSSYADQWPEMALARGAAHV